MTDLQMERLSVAESQNTSVAESAALD